MQQEFPRVARVVPRVRAGGSCLAGQRQRTGVGTLAWDAERCRNRLCSTRRRRIGERVEQRGINSSIVMGGGRYSGGWSDNDNNLALRLVIGVASSERAQRAGHTFFMQLGELARDGGIALAEPRRKCSQTGPEPLSALVQHQAGTYSGQLGYRLVARLGLGWKKSGEQEPIGRKPRQCQPGDCRAWARNAGHHPSRGACIAHKPIAGVGNQGCSGIAHQHDAFIGHPFDEPGARRIIGMIVMAQQRPFDSDQMQQMAGDARILASNDVSGQQNLARTGTYVA